MPSTVLERESPGNQKAILATEIHVLEKCNKCSDFRRGRPKMPEKIAITADIPVNDRDNGNIGHGIDLRPRTRANRLESRLQN